MSPRVRVWVAIPAGRRAERLAWCLAAADRNAWRCSSYLDRALDAVARLSRFRPTWAVAR